MLSENISQDLDRLTELDGPGLASLEGRILDEFTGLESEEPTTDSVESMTSLADALDAVRSELVRRSKLEEELKVKAEEISTRIKKKPEDDMKSEQMLEPGESEDIEVDITDPTSSGDGDEVAEVDIEVKAEEGSDSDTAKPPADEMDEEGEDEKKKKKNLPFSNSSESKSGAQEQTSDGTLELSESSDGTSAGVEGSDGAKPQELTTEAVENSKEMSNDEAPKEGNAMTASTNRPQGTMVPPSGASPTNRIQERSARDGLGLAIVAGADIPGFGAGQQLKDMREVSEAFSRRLHTLSNVMGNEGQRYNVASMKFEYDDERRLGRDDSANFSAIERVTGPEAVTAAGVCVPLETRYDMQICGDSDRPIRDTLARFNADRGGVRIFQAPTLCSSGLGIWNPNPNTYPPAGSVGGSTGGLATVTTFDPATGAATVHTAVAGPTGGQIKTCCEANCPAPHEVYLQALYSCMCFSNYTNRFFPEVVKANTDLALIAQARMAEMFLLGRIKNLAGTAVDWTGNNVPLGVGKGGLGFARDLMVKLISAAYYLRRKHRLNGQQRLRTILPAWVAGAIEADLIQQMPGDSLDVFTVGTSRVDQFLNSHDINVTWSLDSWDKDGLGNDISLTPAAGGFNVEIGFPLFVEGDLLFLDGGTLDLGVTRDSGNIKANDYCTFVETFEEVAFTGCSLEWIQTKVCASGAAAALVANAC